MKKVLQDYGLKHRVVDEKELPSIIMNHRICIATFSLEKKEWHNFSKFFIEHPNGVITADELNRVVPEEEFTARDCDGRHAVVLFGIVGSYYLFINSWGEVFGDNGRFRVEKGAISFNFYDIYWTERSLKAEEKTLWKQRCNQARKGIVFIARMIDVKQQDYRRNLSKIVELPEEHYRAYVNSENVVWQLSEDQMNTLLNFINRLRGGICPFDVDNLIDRLPKVLSILDGEEICDDRTMYTNFVCALAIIPEIATKLKKLCDDFWTTQNSGGV